jgi:uncharacterized membrane protein HdeD (DUF308 family)
VATTTAVSDPSVQWVALALDGLALLVLAVGLAVRLPQVAAAAVSLVAGGYALGLVVDDAPPDLRAPLYATVLLLTCELAVWSQSLARSTPGEAGMLARHAAWLGLLALGMLALGAGLLALVDIARSGGVAIDALGAVAAVAAVTALWRAAGSTR